MSKDCSPLPLFSTVAPEEIQQEIESLVDEIKITIDNVLARGLIDWDNFIAVIADKENALSLKWNVVMHLNSVMSNNALRTAHDNCVNMLSEFGTWKGQHQKLYEAFNSLKKSEDFRHFSISQQKVIENRLEEFELTGIQLSAEKKQRFAEIEQHLSQLSSTFSNNVLDASKAYCKLVSDKDLLKGLPENSIAAAKIEADKRGFKGWAFTLNMPSYFPVMTYSENATLRKELSIAFDARASDCGPNAGEFDNTKVINDILVLRTEKAQLLGFENYAELSLVTKMASGTTEIFEFLNGLSSLSLTQAKGDVAELKLFVESEYGVTTLEPWDIAFYSEKLKQKQHEFSEDELKSYFPEDKVLAGLFNICNKVFGIKVTEVKNSIDTWHPDVRFYNIYDKSGEHKGSIYVDLYARENKRAGAWLSEYSSRHVLKGGKLQKPIAFLTCNFSSPMGGKPALFTHKEVVTLFHEFGHALHHTLTEINEKDVSGINGVLWDAVELPSQLLENWCWHKSSLSLISSHFETGEPLPECILEKMLEAKNFQSARQLSRQLEFSLFDFTIHANAINKNTIEGFVQATFDEVRAKASVVQASVENRFQHSFSHIFAGGYAAGYYSYKWAEVLSADVFSQFESAGIFNAQLGEQFLTKVLAKGGSSHPSVLFKTFMGREPQKAALLNSLNIAT
jgi:oligopeptidase A